MKEKPQYPFLSVVVSGGHTLLLLVKSEFEIVKLGTTIDDAMGEAFDKVSKMLGFGYPGGPLIQKYALDGDDNFVKYPIGKSKNKFDFSYSGLKTSVLRSIQSIEKEKSLTQNDKNNIAASFQKAAVNAITKRVKLALNDFNIKSISLVGGVAANQKLRNEIIYLGEKFHKSVIIPDLEYCGDNAAMIAYRGMQYHLNGDKFDLNENAYPSLPAETFDL